MEKLMYEKAFKAALKEHDLSDVANAKDFYTLIKGSRKYDYKFVKLICAEDIDPTHHGSRCGNEIKAIAHFKFKVPRWEEKVAHFIFVFNNPEDESIEFIIVSEDDLRSRFEESDKKTSTNRKLDMTFWLMPDRHLYEATYLNYEDEQFYFLSEVEGRLVDDSVLDYTQCLNNWDGLLKSFE